MGFKAPSAASAPTAAADRTALITAGLADGDYGHTTTDGYAWRQSDDWGGPVSVAMYDLDSTTATLEDIALALHTPADRLYAWKAATPLTDTGVAAQGVAVLSGTAARAATSIPGCQGQIGILVHNTDKVALPGSRTLTPYGGRTIIWVGQSRGSNAATRALWSSSTYSTLAHSSYIDTETTNFESSYLGNNALFVLSAAVGSNVAWGFDDTNYGIIASRWQPRTYTTGCYWIKNGDANVSTNDITHLWTDATGFTDLSTQGITIGGNLAQYFSVKQDVGFFAVVPKYLEDWELNLFSKRMALI